MGIHIIQVNCLICFPGASCCLRNSVCSYWLHFSSQRSSIFVVADNIHGVCDEIIHCIYEVWTYCALDEANVTAVTSSSFLFSCKLKSFSSELFFLIFYEIGRQSFYVMLKNRWIVCSNSS